MKLQISLRTFGAITYPQEGEVAAAPLLFLESR
jgi:hypothetical protein